MRRQAARANLGRWVEARWLRPADRLLMRTGVRATVSEPTIRMERVQVYNLQRAQGTGACTPPGQRMTNPPKQQPFVDLVGKHFDFLLDDYGFEPSKYIHDHASCQLEYRGRCLSLSIVYERFIQLCIWVTLTRTEIGLDILNVYTLLGVAESDAYEYEGALTTDGEQIDRSLSQMARRLRMHGARVLEQDPTLIAAIESQRRT